MEAIASSLEAIATFALVRLSVLRGKVLSAAEAVAAARWNGCDAAVVCTGAVAQRGQRVTCVGRADLAGARRGGQAALTEALILLLFV